MSIQNYDKPVEDRGRAICFWTLNNDYPLFPPPPTPEKSTPQKLSNKYFFLKFIKKGGKIYLQIFTISWYTMSSGFLNSGWTDKDTYRSSKLPSTNQSIYDPQRPQISLITICFHDLHIRTTKYRLTNRHNVQHTINVGISDDDLCPEIALQLAHRGNI